MRDAFGGSFMIKLFIVFIIIYAGFTAIALNYAKAFKVKNKVIEYLEDNEVTDISKMNAREWNTMDSYFEKELLGDMNYHGTISCDTKKTSDPDLIITVQYCNNGIKIEKNHYNKSNKEGDYFTVYTTFGWSIPFLNKLLQINNQDGAVQTGTWIIKGETRTIVNE